MRAAIALLLTGCNAILDLHEFGADANDAGAYTVTGTLNRAVVDGTGTHLTPFDPSHIHLSVGHASSIGGDIAIDDLGNFAFETTGPYQIRIDDGSDQLQQYDSASPTVELRVVQYGRDNVVPIDRQKIKVMPSDVSIAYTVASLGVYASHQDSAPKELEWDTMTFVGTPGTLDASAGDALVFVELETVAGFLRPSATRTLAVMMSPGGSTIVDGNLATPVTNDRCARLTTGGIAELARLGATALPADGQGFGWAVNAIIAPDYGIAGLPIAGATSANVDAHALDLRFATPYPGLVPMLQLNAGFANAIAVAGQPPIAILTGTNVVVPVDSDCENDDNLAVHVAAPSIATLDGHLLDVTDQPIVLDRTRPVHLTWSDRIAGPHDAYFVQVDELGGSTAATTVTRVIQARTTSPETWLSPLRLVADRTYLITIVAVIGKPAIATGNFWRTGYPVETTSTMARTFVAK